MFEQYSIGGVLSYDFIRENLSIVERDRLQELTQTILQGDVVGLTNVMNRFKMDSIDPDRFFVQYLYFLKDIAFESIQSPEFPKIMRLFEAGTLAYSKIKFFPNGFLLLEMMLLGQIQSISDTPTTPSSRAKIESAPKAPPSQ